jgi:hypothetical protein
MEKDIGGTPFHVRMVSAEFGFPFSVEHFDRDHASERRTNSRCEIVSPKASEGQS